MARVLTCYPGPRPGGLCRRLFRAIEALLARGHTVDYLAVAPFPIDHPRCRFHRLPAPRREGWAFWAWLHLAMPPALLVLGLSRRTTHAFAFGATYGLFLQPLRLLGHVPTAVFLRADAIENHRLRGRPPWLVGLEARLEGVALAGMRVFAVSRALAAAVEARHPRLAGRVEVLPNDLPAAPAAHGAEPSGGSSAAGKLGGDASPERGARWSLTAEGAPPPRRAAPSPAPPRSAAPFPAGEPPPRPAGEPLRAAAVGVLESRKNLALLVDALALLPPGAVRLTLYGDGPQAAGLAGRARRLGVEGAVAFAGWVPAAAIWPAVDLLLMPSLHEGAPNAVLEALAAGVPVLASDLPEHREILPPAALLPPRDPAAWAERLARVAAEPAAELPALAAAGAAAAARLRFDWDEALARRVLGQPAEAP